MKKNKDFILNTILFLGGSMIWLSSTYTAMKVYFFLTASVYAIAYITIAGMLNAKTLGFDAFDKKAQIRNRIMRRIRAQHRKMQKEAKSNKGVA